MSPEVTRLIELVDARVASMHHSLSGQHCHLWEYEECSIDCHYPDDREELLAYLRTFSYRASGPHYYTQQRGDIIIELRVTEVMRYKEKCWILIQDQSGPAFIEKYILTPQPSYSILIKLSACDNWVAQYKGDRKKLLLNLSNRFIKMLAEESK